MYTHKTGLMTNTLLANFFSFILIFIIFFLFTQIDSTKKEFYALLEPANSLSKEDMVAEISKLKSSFIYIEIAKYLVAISAGLFIVVTIWNDKRNIAINNTLNNFETRLAVLAPEISDKKLLILRRKWALMLSYNDYLSIKKELDELYTQYGL